MRFPYFRAIRGGVYALLLGLAMILWGSHSTSAGTVSQVPLFVTQSVEPRIMLIMSNDHQLYIKAYNDYSDLNNDGAINATYTDSIDYYGYFGVNTCYTYSSADGRFNPSSNAQGPYGHHCTGTGEWSGNFLNWASMTRMDIIRKVLYGGYRSTDTESLTVLERALLPYDVHAFAKVFTAATTGEMLNYTPYAETSVSMCNVTYVTTGISNTVSAPPELRIARGDWPLWASSEVTQCTWGTGGTDVANRVRPVEATHKLGVLNARVSVCRPGYEESNCKTYPNLEKKPTGLLQTYSEGTMAAPLRFGLMTGSYQRNKSGGVLRRNIERLVENNDSSKNEINMNTGQFINQGASDGGIINTLNRLRISSYNYGTRNYGHSCGSPGILSFTDGQCVEWGNPLSEMYLEALRYMAGKTSPTTAFNANDSTYISSLPQITWVDPIPDEEWCANCSLVVISTGLNSFDTDQLSNDLGIDANARTDEVGILEGLSNQLLVGQSAADTNKRCTAKTVSGLSEAKGICPEVPSMEGGYHIAGLAYHARTNDLRPAQQGEQILNTYTVALAESLPRFEIPVDSGAITILPACEANSTAGANHNSSGWRVCSMTDLVVESLTYSSDKIVSGSLLVNWEDSTWGSDYDMDGISRLQFCVGSACNPAVGSNQMKITTSAQQAYAGHALRFGYTITGSTEDGMHLPVLRPGGSNFSILAGGSRPSNVTEPTPHTRTAGASAGQLLENPLWYTAKYGGFVDQDSSGTPNLVEEWDSNDDGVPDNYFKATNPAHLVEALGSVFQNVVETTGSAASVVANSVRLDTGTYIYQARFRTMDWSGELIAYPVLQDGSIGDMLWEAGNEIPAPEDRNIFTFNPSGTPQGVSFEWDNLNEAQKNHLMGTGDEALGQARLNYIRGVRTGEVQYGGTFRDRNRLLGDIVNSDPVYVSAANFGYNVPSISEGFTDNAYNSFREANKNRTQMIYLGANDGMFHGFRADDGEEVFAFVPNEVFANLADLTMPAYEHQYYVDGPPRVGDAYINGEWRTILLGSTGAGGKSVFALDVTDPDDFSASDILWEFTHADMGYTIGQPSIARLTNGAWVAIFGNGYGSAGHKAMLFIVDLETGALINAIDTGAGTELSPNGLSTPIPVDTTNNRITQYVYAGDLQGNLWKFDLTHTNSGQWDVAFTHGHSRYPLFTARDEDGAVQPITARPAVGGHPDGGVMVYFGTGKFFQVGDNNISESDSRQSFYGIRDTGTRIVTTDRSELQMQEITHELPGFGWQLRVTSKNAVNYDDSSDPTDNPIKHGWYMDLISPVDGYEGERVVSYALLRHQRVIFNTLIPSGEPCDHGGASWLMELDALTGGRLDYSVFDLNKDNLFNFDDYVTVEVEQDGETEEVTVPVSGKRSKVGIIKTPAVISAGEVEYKFFSGSSGIIETIKEKSGSGEGIGRQSWRQLQ